MPVEAGSHSNINWDWVKNHSDEELDQVLKGSAAGVIANLIRDLPKQPKTMTSLELSCRVFVHLREDNLSKQLSSALDQVGLFPVSSQPNDTQNLHSELNLFVIGQTLHHTLLEALKIKNRSAATQILDKLSSFLNRLGCFRSTWTYRFPQHSLLLLILTHFPDSDLIKQVAKEDDSDFKKKVFELKYELETSKIHRDAFAKLPEAEQITFCATLAPHISGNKLCGFYATETSSLLEHPDCMEIMRLANSFFSNYLISFFSNYLIIDSSENLLKIIQVLSTLKAEERTTFCQLIEPAMRRENLHNQLNLINALIAVPPIERAAILELAEKLTGNGNELGDVITGLARYPLEEREQVIEITKPLNKINSRRVQQTILDHFHRVPKNNRQQFVKSVEKILLSSPLNEYKQASAIAHLSYLTPIPLSERLSCRNLSRLSGNKQITLLMRSHLAFLLSQISSDIRAEYAQAIALLTNKTNHPETIFQEFASLKKLSPPLAMAKILAPLKDKDVAIAPLLEALSSVKLEDCLEIAQAAVYLLSASPQLDQKKLTEKLIQIPKGERVEFARQITSLSKRAEEVDRVSNLMEELMKSPKNECEEQIALVEGMSNIDLLDLCEVLSALRKTPKQERQELAALFHAFDQHFVPLHKFAIQNIRDYYAETPLSERKSLVQLTEVFLRHLKTSPTSDGKEILGAILTIPANKRVAVSSEAMGALPTDFQMDQAALLELIQVVKNISVSDLQSTFNFSALILNSLVHQHDFSLSKMIISLLPILLEERKSLKENLAQILSSGIKIDPQIAHQLIDFLSKMSSERKIVFSEVLHKLYTQASEVGYFVDSNVLEALMSIPEDSLQEVSIAFSHLLTARPWLLNHAQEIFPLLIAAPSEERELTSQSIALLLDSTDDRLEAILNLTKTLVEAPKWVKQCLCDQLKLVNRTEITPSNCIFWNNWSDPLKKHIFTFQNKRLTKALVTLLKGWLDEESASRLSQELMRVGGFGDKALDYQALVVHSILDESRKRPNANPYRLYTYFQKEIPQEPLLPIQASSETMEIKKDEETVQKSVIWNLGQLREELESQGYKSEHIEQVLKGCEYHIGPEALQQLFEKFELRLRGLPPEHYSKVMKEIETNFGQNFSNLKQNGLNEDLLEWVKPPASPAEAVSTTQFQAISILRFLLESNSKLKEGELITEQERYLLLLGSTIRNCKTGKKYGVDTFYNNTVPMHYKIGLAAASSEARTHTLAKLLPIYQKELAEVLASNKLAQSIGQNSLVQMPHIIAYLKSRFGRQAGLLHDPEFDLHTFLVDEKVLTADKQEVINQIFELLKITKVFKSILRSNELFENPTFYPAAKSLICEADRITSDNFDKNPYLYVIFDEDLIPQQLTEWGAYCLMKGLKFFSEEPSSKSNK